LHFATAVARIASAATSHRVVGDGMNRADEPVVARDRRNRDDDRIDILVYVVWVAVLLILLRYL
jgi:hypothetical protein